MTTYYCRCGAARLLSEMAFADTPIGPSYLCDECAEGWALTHDLMVKDHERQDLEADETNKLCMMVYDHLCEDNAPDSFIDKYPSLSKAIYDFRNQQVGDDPIPGGGYAVSFSVWTHVWDKVSNDE